jgi:hypothetical protein
MSAASLQAGIITTTGDVQVWPSATADYRPDAYNDRSSKIRLWFESSGPLAAPLTLDSALTNPAQRYGDGFGSAEDPINFQGGPTLPAGTVVESYLAYFDPKCIDASFGTVTFDSEVLGVFVYTRALADSDALRVAGAPYPANPAFPFRGLELGFEWLQLSADRTTLTIANLAITPGDQMRILVAGPADQVTPEPGTWALLGAGFIVLGLARKRIRVFRA